MFSSIKNFFDIILQIMALPAHSSSPQDSKPTHFGASLFAGFLGASFSQPLDVAKTRMMNQRLVQNSEVHYYQPLSLSSLSTHSPLLRSI